MRIGIFSDVHGNLQAVQAVLLEMARAGCQQLFCLGDIATLGPEPVRTLNLLMKIECRFVLGNHDRYLLNPADVDAYDTVEGVRRNVKNVSRLLNTDHLAFLRSFEPLIRIEIEGHRLCLFHGSPKSDESMMLKHLPTPTLLGMLGPIHDTLYIGGHIHSPYDLNLPNCRLINAGSVGSPFSGWDFQMNRPVFDTEGSFLILDLTKTEVRSRVVQFPL